MSMGKLTGRALKLAHSCCCCCYLDDEHHYMKSRARTKLKSAHFQCAFSAADLLNSSKLMDLHHVFKIRVKTLLEIVWSVNLSSMPLDFTEKYTQMLSVIITTN